MNCIHYEQFECFFDKMCKKGEYCVIKDVVKLLPKITEVIKNAELDKTKTQTKNPPYGGAML